MPRFEEQIVVFIDVLGFTKKIPVFEIEALNNAEPDDPLFHESQSLSVFLDIVDNATKLIEKYECRSYLFSDNICITVQYGNRPDILVEILILLASLTEQFVQKGYFIRGGIDVGWFLDSEDVAIGNPLVNAYHLENIAIYPRVLISEAYYNKLVEYKDSNLISELLEERLNHYIRKVDNLFFLNPFYFISNYEDKILKVSFLTHYSLEISNQLATNSADERVYNKYFWLGKEFNTFINWYSNSFAECDLVEDESNIFDAVDIQTINESTQKS